MEEPQMPIWPGCHFKNPELVQARPHFYGANPPSHQSSLSFEMPGSVFRTNLQIDSESPPISHDNKKNAEKAKKKGKTNFGQNQDSDEWLETIDHWAWKAGKEYEWFKNIKSDEINSRNSCACGKRALQRILEKVWHALFCSLLPVEVSLPRCLWHRLPIGNIGQRKNKTAVCLQSHLWRRNC